MKWIFYLSLLALLCSSFGCRSQPQSRELIPDELYLPGNSSFRFHSSSVAAAEPFYIYSLKEIDVIEFEDVEYRLYDVLVGKTLADAYGIRLFASPDSGLYSVDEENALSFMLGQGANPRGTNEYLNFMKCYVAIVGGLHEEAEYEQRSRKLGSKEEWRYFVSYPHISGETRQVTFVFHSRELPQVLLP